MLGRRPRLEYFTIFDDLTLFPAYAHHAGILESNTNTIAAGGLETSTCLHALDASNSFSSHALHSHSHSTPPLCSSRTFTQSRVEKVYRKRMPRGEFSIYMDSPSHVYSPWKKAPRIVPEIQEDRLCPILHHLCQSCPASRKRTKRREQSRMSYSNRRWRFDAMRLASECQELLPELKGKGRPFPLCTEGPLHLHETKNIVTCHAAVGEEDAIGYR